MAEVLDDAVVLMRDRAARLAGVARTHRPSRDEPLVVVIIDELANLTAYLPTANSGTASPKRSRCYSPRAGLSACPRWRLCRTPAKKWWLSGTSFPPRSP
jgi:hypothetical protein